MPETKAKVRDYVGSVRKLWRSITSTIRGKLLATTLSLSLVPLTILGVVGYLDGSKELHELAYARLEQIRDDKQEQVEDWLHARTSDAYFAKNLVVVREGIPIFETHKNNHRHPAFRQARFRAESVLGSFAETIGGGIYTDIDIASTSGEILFALDWSRVGENVADTEAFRNGIQRLHITDSDENLELTVSTPVSNDHGDRIGVLLMVLDLHILNSKMTSQTASAGTGDESFLIGPDNLFRTESAYLEDLQLETSILNPAISVTSAAAQSALAGETGRDRMQSYHGDDVLIAYAPIEVRAPSAGDPNGLSWALLAEAPVAVVYRSARTLGYLTLLIVVLGAILVVIVSFKFAGGINRQIDSILGLFKDIDRGVYSSRCEVTSTDELGGMAGSLNTVVAQTEENLETSRRQGEELNAGIMRLLNDISGIADGDFSQSAAVTEDATGAIADSFNFMLEELVGVIGRVQETTLQVSSAANEIQTTTEHLAQGSESQSVQIVDTSAAIEEMAQSIQQVAENATTSASVAEQALSNAKQGSDAVRKTSQGMDVIREHVQESAKRIKQLGESSQEIGEITQLISDIADRTSILALNASIQAAMAGEAGRGFAVVAEEVERLAERATDATKQISTLIKGIQIGTHDAVEAMERTTVEVVSGSKLALAAGTALEEIEGVSQRLAELISSISMAAKQQARGSESVASSMSNISDVTQSTAAGTKQAATAISNLATLADSLNESVSEFKLPDVR